MCFACLDKQEVVGASELAKLQLGAEQAVKRAFAIA